MNDLDTIVALSTPKGIGAIALIRLSGKKSFAIIDTYFSKKSLLTKPSHTIHYGTFEVQGKVIDDIVVSIFKSPHSYTGEDTIEISCHGSNYIINTIIKSCIDEGARIAQAGEFTQRAFLHGKLDLSQAEAVADLIAAESQAAHDIAIRQIRGGISNKLKSLRTALIEFTALIELELDFSEEDVEFADRGKLYSLLRHIKEELHSIAETFHMGNAIKNGIPVAIVGRPNAGKSTLLNALLQEERAIVSSIAGTTRDTIEETLNIDGYLFRFIDTAGIRMAKDEIEKIGIARSNEAMSKAEVIIYLFDLEMDISPDTIQQDFKEIMEKVGANKKVIIVGNKVDAISTEKLKNLKELFDNTFIAVSAKQQSGIETLKNTLVATIAEKNIGENNVVVTNQRHYEALNKAESAITAVIHSLQNNIPRDLIAQDIKVALRHIGEITGHIDIDKDILGTIFGRFCIGK
jgi:tRNA modification GTPase